MRLSRRTVKFFRFRRSRDLRENHRITKSPGHPIRDVTVGRLLTRLAELLPDHEALVYSDRNLRWTFRGSNRKRA